MTERRYPGPSVREIANMLRPHAESLGRMIFPNAVRAGPYLCIGSIHGEPGDSLKIHLSGIKQGAWVDYAKAKGDPEAMGDMLRLVQMTLGGGDMVAGIKEAKRFLQLDTMDPRAMERQLRRAEAAQKRAEERQAADDEQRRKQAEGMWIGAARLTRSSAPVRYLEARGIDFARLGKLPGAIRYRHDMPHKDTGRALPCMLTKMQTPDGKHAATHQTFLQLGPRGWTKLPDMERIDEATGEVRTIKVAKKIFGPAWLHGAHIPLWKGAHDCKLADLPRGVAVEASEGIEDGLSYALANPEARVVAAGTLGLIGQMRLPPQVGQLNILAQRDEKETAQRALESAIAEQQQRARAEGVERVIACRWPPEGVNDWNDWLRGDAA